MCIRDSFHYYAERKGLALSPAWNIELIRSMADKPSLVFGDIEIGGIVQCENKTAVKNHPEASAIAEKLTEQLLAESQGRWKEIKFKKCRLFYRTDL